MLLIQKLFQQFDIITLFHEVPHVQTISYLDLLQDTSSNVIVLPNPVLSAEVLLLATDTSLQTRNIALAQKLALATACTTRGFPIT